MDTSATLTNPYSGPTKVQIADKAVTLMREAGLNPGMLKNVHQVGWVNKTHNKFMSMTELTVAKLDGGVAYAQNTEWVPVFTIDGVQ